PVGCPSGRRETMTRRVSELVVARQSELLPVATGLLEVVAHDLVQLDEPTAVSLEPPRESLVQLRPRSLRQRVVGRVADEKVAEAEAILARKLRRLGPDQRSADERREAPGHVRFFGRERLDRPAVEELALDRAALQHAPLGRIELVEAG